NRKHGLVIVVAQQLDDRRVRDQCPLHPGGATVFVEHVQERDTGRSKMTYPTNVEHQGVSPEDETPNALADAIDIEGVDNASDGHHCRQVTTVSPNLCATAVQGAFCHKRPHSLRRCEGLNTYQTCLYGACKI